MRGKKSEKDCRFHRAKANGRVCWDLCGKGAGSLSRLFLKEVSLRRLSLIASMTIVKMLDKPTVIVIDNAPIHRSEEFEESLEEWEQKRLAIYYLPTYSSELNKIEMLWKKIKHEWLPLEAYQSYQKLTEELDKVLSKIGSLYKITFS